MTVKKIPRPVLEGDEAFSAWLASLCTGTTARQVAFDHGLSGPMFSALIHGRQSIGPETAARFGYRIRRVKIFEPIEDK